MISHGIQQDLLEIQEEEIICFGEGIPVVQSMLFFLSRRITNRVGTYDRRVLLVPNVGVGIIVRCQLLRRHLLSH